MASHLEIVHARLYDALERMDLLEVQQLFARASSLLASREVALGFLPSLLTEVGDRWARDELSVAQEHAVSVAVRNLLGTLLVVHQTAAQGPAAVATTPLGERHEFGAMLATLIAVMRGWRVVYLGPELSAEELALAARRTAARAALLSAPAMAPAPLVREVGAIGAALPPSTDLLVGGTAASRCRDRLVGERTCVLGLEGLEGYLEAWEESRI